MKAKADIRKRDWKMGLVAIWGLITILTYLSPLLNPLHLAAGIVAIVAYPVVLGINFLLLIWLLYRANYRTALVIVFVMAVGWPLHSSLMGFNSTSQQPEQSDLKIATFNINYGWNIQTEDRHNTASLAAYLKNHKKPDILCLQEYITDMDEWLLEALPYTHVINNRPYRTAIFTNHEVLDRGYFNFDNYENSVVWADIDIPEKGVVRVYNLHLQTNQVTDDSRKIRDRGLDFDEETAKTLWGILRNYQRAASIRVEQVTTVLEHAKNSPYPVFIAGDINDVPISYIYRKLSYGRKDTFTERGRGLGVTYKGPLPFLRIDLILADPEFKVIRHDIIEGDFSDHKPVVAWLRW